MEIEALFSEPLLIVPDATHSKSETRIRALGRASAGRMIFLVFTIRLKGGRRVVRPISARYKHAKDVASRCDDTNGRGGRNRSRVVPPQDPGTYEFKALSQCNSVNRGTGLST